MKTMGRCRFTTMLTATLSIALIAASAPAARADDQDDAQQKAEHAREEAQRAREEAQRAREEQQRAREEAQQRAQEAKQRAQDEKQRIKEEQQRAKEEQREREQEQRERAQEQREREAEKHEDKKSGRTSAKVKGPVRFSVEVVNADIQVTATGKDTVSIAAKKCAPDDLELDGDVDEFEGDFSEWGSCEGPVVVVVPVGSSVNVSTVQGNLRLKGSYKEIEASSVAGTIEIDSGDDVQVEAVQGKVKIGSARRAQVESVAGDVELTTVGTTPIVSIETVNGNVRWTGACGKGCRASIESFQGSSTLTLDAKLSSFELRFATQSGKLNDQLGTQTSANGKNVKGYSPTRARYGKAEGSVRVETYQGNLELKKK